MPRKIMNTMDAEKLRRYQRGVRNTFQRLCAAARIGDQDGFEGAMYDIYQMIDDVAELAGFHERE